MPTFTYCPVCSTPLTTGIRGDRERQYCLSCGWTHWNNPVPVVAAIVERNDHVMLVRSIGWPEGWFGLVTGFLEKGESPEDGVVREVKEELGLDAKLERFIGLYPFHRMNQIIMAYHLTAHEGDITLDTEELEAYKAVPIEKVQPWGSGTGYALQDWLASKGIEREVVPLFRAKKD